MNDENIDILIEEANKNVSTENVDDREESVDSEKNADKNNNKKSSFKNIFGSNLTTREYIVKQIPFIMFLTFLSIVYIANKYNAQKLVRETSKIQKELKNTEITAEAADGQIEVVFNGQQELKSIKIDPEMLTKEKHRELETGLKSAIEEAIKQSQKVAQEQ